MRRDPATDPDLAPPTLNPGPRALDYGTDHRQRRVRPHHVVLSLVLIACIGGSWTLGRSARAQAQTLLYVKQASNHVQQDTTVVFEGNPEAARKLIEAGTHHAVDSTGKTAAINSPESLQVFKEGIDAAGALVFLHELTTPSGMRRIVVVHYLPQYINGHLNPQAGLIAHIFEPGGLLSRPQLIGESRSKLLISANRQPGSDPELDAPTAAVHSDPDLEGLVELPHDPFAQAAGLQDTLHMGLNSRVLQETFDPWGRTPTARWYAGQPDSSDPSHFTIEFELDGRSGTIDGFLADDGRHVRMQARPREGFARNSTKHGLQIHLPPGF